MLAVWKLWIMGGLILQVAAGFPPTVVALRPSPNRYSTDPANPEHTNADDGMIVAIDNTPEPRERRAYLASIILIALGGLAQLIGVMQSP